MRTNITKFLVLALLAISSSVFGATSSYEGGTGMPYMRTADTVPDGVLDVHFRLGVDKFEREGISDSLFNSSLGMTYGLLNRWEIGMDMPYLSGVGEGSSGIPYLKIFTKARLSGGRESGHSFGFNAYGTAMNSDAENEIGSGEGGYGAEVNFSLYEENFGRLGKDFSMHFSLGKEKTDFKQFVGPVPFTSEELTKLSLGLEYRPGDTYSVTLEAIGTQIPESNDENALLVPGFAYHPTKNFTYHLGAAIGLPDERSQPAYRIFAGLSYNFFKEKSARKPWLEPIVEEEEAAPEPIPSPFSIESDVHELPPEEIRKPAPKAKPKPVPAPVVRTRPAPKPKPVVKAKPKPRPKPVVKPKPRPKPVVKVKPKPKPKPKPVVKASPKPAPVAKSTKQARVEIWNASGSAGLAVKIAKRLRKKGFKIFKVGGVKYYRKATTIYYGPGFEDHANKIAKVLWQEGDIESTYSLHSNIDVQIIIGTDMKKVWKIWNTN